MQTATFAAGCFWGVEAMFRQLNGVVSTQVGYTGGHTDSPTYEQVCTGQTGHAEAVDVLFDPAVIVYDRLLDVFWKGHDPTTLNRQGADIGSQYRSAIFFHTTEQQHAAEACLQQVQQSHTRPVVTEILPAGPFYPAEDYHQQYFEKRGQGMTCH